jgi:demethylmenaquinone methyltransferase/2-methoxy-6-polyprenyl-1,4-benzoquinol methylase
MWKLGQGIMSKSESQGKFLRTVYSRIAEKYELTNHVMTFGLDVIWRKAAAKMAVNAACAMHSGGDQGAESWLDTCTGTGEMAAYLRRLADKDARANVKLFGLDFSKEMLDEATKKPGCDRISLCCGDMDDLPFPDETFSLVTMAFATRNNNPDRETLVHRFSEIHRILEPGGIFVNVETSQPSSSLLIRLRNLFVKIYIPWTAAALTGDKKGYSYLAESIPRFYGADELAIVLKESGFVDVEPTKLMFGVAAAHRAWKG